MTETDNQIVGVCNSNSGGYRPEWWPRIPMGNTGPDHIMSPLEICQELHMDHVGSVDPLPEFKRRLYIRSVEWLVDNWKEPSSMFDRAVRTLCQRTLNERLPRPDRAPDIVCRRQSDV